MGHTLCYERMYRAVVVPLVLDGCCSNLSTRSTMGVSRLCYLEILKWCSKCGLQLYIWFK